MSLFGGFHSHGGTKNGWFIMEKSPATNGWWFGGTPMTQETTISSIDSQYWLSKVGTKIWRARLRILFPWWRIPVCWPRDGEPTVFAVELFQVEARLDDIHRHIQSYTHVYNRIQISLYTYVYIYIYIHTHILFTLLNVNASKHVFHIIVQIVYLLVLQHVNPNAMSYSYTYNIIYTYIYIYIHIHIYRYRYTCVYIYNYI